MSDESDPYRAPQTTDLAPGFRHRRHSGGTIATAWFMQLFLTGLLARVAGFVLGILTFAAIGTAMDGIFIAAGLAIASQIAISYFCFRLAVQWYLDYGANRLTNRRLSKIERDTSYLDDL